MKNVKFPMWYTYSLAIKHFTALKKILVLKFVLSA